MVALDASDGRVIWETDTSVDLVDVESTQRFVDVDTTPAVAGDLVYVASFAGGLYALELANGTVHAHEGDLRGITGVERDDRRAWILSSAERRGRLELPQLSVRWRHRVDRGAPGKTQVHGDNVYFAESLGALLALSLADGREMGRLETPTASRRRRASRAAWASRCRTPRSSSASATEHRADRGFRGILGPAARS